MTAFLTSGGRQRDPMAKFRDPVRVPLEPQPGTVWNPQHPVPIKLWWLNHDAVDVIAGRQILDPTRVTGCGHELKIGGETHTGVPTVRDHQDRMIIGILADSMLLADAADLGDIWLNVIHRAAFDPRDERLPAREHFAATDVDGRMFAEQDVAVDVVGTQRFLEPAHVELRKHLRSLQRPLVSVR